MGDVLVLRVVVKVLISFILLYALYVQFHGDYGAGGGFQAGVVFATAFVVYDLVFGEADVRRVLPPLWLGRLAGFGILVFPRPRGGCFLPCPSLFDFLSPSPDTGHWPTPGTFLFLFGRGLSGCSGPPPPLSPISRPRRP
ncbi:MAG: hypothetical protein H8E15_01715, partial [Planctomycetes bacterium]|nr:hypothetical protein [Planctomycetota bacterium]